MAPTAVERTTPAAAPAPSKAQQQIDFREKLTNQADAQEQFKDPVDWDPSYKYAWALPWFDVRYRDPNFKDAPYEAFEHVDVGHRAKSHPNPRSFLANAALDDLTPRFGTTVKGVDLTKLSSDERDQLSLFVAERGVVVFEGQDAFIDQTPEQLKEFGSHYSQRLHQHQVSGQPKDHPEFHLVYKSPTKNLNNNEQPDKFVPTVWHSDVSYEAQPPGLTLLFLFDTPETGGDTGFTDAEELLNRLSPSLREYLSGLTAIHSGVEQAEAARKGATGVVKRNPVESEHPIVRTHPVTGRKSLYVNEGFTRRIVGLRREESDALLKLLFQLNHIAVDAQIRVRWRKGSVVFWDNRRTQHTPIVDFSDGRRHGARITPAAERPFQ